MLQKLREKTTGWIATVILGLLVIPFAFFGMESYLQQRVDTWVAKVEAPPSWWAGAPAWWPASMLWQREFVEASDFRDRYEQIRAQQREEQGEAFDNRAFESAANKRVVLDQLVDERVLRLASRRAGIAVSDALVRDTIQAIPAFQVGGKFNPQQYQLALASAVPARTPRQFEDLVRQDLEQSLLPSRLAESAIATGSELDRVLRLINEKRDVAFITLPPPAPDTGPVSAAEIASWYKAHAQDYKAPETVDFEYVEVTADSLSAPAEADEAELRRRYEQAGARFNSPERRLASHILVEVAADADAAAQRAAQQEAQRIAAQAKAANADFAALARSASDDAGSKANGGDLGWLEKGAMDKAFEEALFAMKAGEVRGPVKSAFGWHVIQLREVQASQGAPFEQVREQLVAEQAQADRERAFNDLVGKLVDQVYKNPTALAPAAAALGLRVQVASDVARGTGTGVAAWPAVQRAAFSETLIQDGTVSDPIEIAADHTVMLRVTAHKPERTLPLAQVSERVVAAIRADRGAKATRATADAMVARLRAGASMDEVAAAQQRPVTSLQRAERSNPALGPATEAVFQLPAPAPGKANAGVTTLPDGSTMVFAVTAVTPGDPAGIPQGERETLRQQLARAAGVDDARAFIATMRRQWRIDVAEDRL